MSQSLQSLDVLNTLTLKQVFWKTKIFFKKLEYRFLLEITAIKNATFPYNTALSKDNLNRTEYKMDLSQREEFCH